MGSVIPSSDCTYINAIPIYTTKYPVYSQISCFQSNRFINKIEIHVHPRFTSLTAFNWKFNHPSSSLFTNTIHFSGMYFTVIMSHVFKADWKIGIFSMKVSVIFRMTTIKIAVPVINTCQLYASNNGKGQSKWFEYKIKLFFIVIDQNGSICWYWCVRIQIPTR